MQQIWEFFLELRHVKRYDNIMDKEKLYSSGEFAKMAHITKKTLRYYDEHNILKPVVRNENGNRYYSDADFARLQQIILLKYLGFSLDDIKEMTIDDSDYHFMAESLNLQLKLVQDRIEHLQNVEKAIRDTSLAIEKQHTIDWNQMLDLIHMTGMEKSLKNQYQDASNITSRINLHKRYSVNKQGWFNWVFEQCMKLCNQIYDQKTEELNTVQSRNMNILEIGCGDGSLWSENMDAIPGNVSITLTDVSEGMLRDARRNIGPRDKRFSFKVADCNKLPYKDESFDIIIADHVLFYCEDVGKAAKELSRCLKSDGVLISSTYGTSHMQEISRLVSDFDDRILLSKNHLYEKFGKENGRDLLMPYFPEGSCQWRQYEDFLLVTEPEALISYILSCHGNQNQYILDRYNEFRTFVKKRTDKGFKITKDAGMFVICKMMGKQFANNV